MDKREKTLARISAWEHRGGAAKSLAGVQRAIDALDAIALAASESALQQYALQSSTSLAARCGAVVSRSYLLEAWT